MKEKIDVLVLEDRPEDAELQVHELRRAGLELTWQRVETQSEYLAALEPAPDIILADYNLPEFDGMRALRLAQELGADIPFILVSGGIGEERAVDAIKQGATDYVMKDRLARLGPAVVRALEEKHLREENRRAEQALRLSEDRYRDIVESSQDLICTHDLEGRILSVNLWAAKQLGYEVDALLKMNLRDLIAPQAQAMFADYWKQIAHTGTAEGLIVVQPRTGATRTWEYKNSLRTEGVAAPIVRGLARDVTERVYAEQALRESEQKYRSIVESSVDSIAILDEQGYFIEWNRAAEQNTGLPRAEILGKSFQEVAFELILPQDKQAFLDLENASAPGDMGYVLPTSVMIPNREFKVTRSDGTRRVNEVSFFTITSAAGFGLGAIWRDITKRKQAEESLRHQVAELEAVSRISAALPAAETENDMLSLLLGETLAALGCEAGVIWLYDPAQDELRISVARGWFRRLEAFALKPGEGITGSVFVNGQVYHTREFAADTLTYASAIEQVPAGWSGVCVPIRESENVGVLLVSAKLPREITPQESKLVLSLAEIAGSALHRLRLHYDLEYQLSKLQTLHNIDMVINTSFDLHTTMSVIVKEMTAHMPIDAASVHVLDANTHTLTLVAAQGFQSNASKHPRLHLGEGYVGQAMLGRRLVSVPDLEKNPDGFKWSPMYAHEGFVSYFVLPLIAKGKMMGVLELFHRTRVDANQKWLDSFYAVATQAAIAIDNAMLFGDLQLSRAELVLAYDATIEGWSHALDLRDKETQGHSVRVTEMTLRLARAMGIAEQEIIHIRRGALLHDIGKMAVPDEILLKPGKLTEEEWVVMKKHPEVALTLLSPIHYLHAALDIPYYHHEKWDGSGYPRGLQGEQIPMAARIFAVADVWDATTSDRPYREAWTRERARENIIQERGKHFDPRVVDVFLAVLDAEAQIPIL